MFNLNHPNHRNNRNNPKGFTFTEVIISMGLFIVLAGVGVGAYFRYYGFALINQDIHNAQSILSEARFLSQKNPTSSDYGIHVDPATETLTLFREAYVPGAPGNKSVKLEALQIAILNLNPVPGVTKDIIFEKQTGKTVNWGTFMVGDSDYTYTFDINAQGVLN
jgi:type II secretory pathway pseudopilin PulG